MALLPVSWLGLFCFVCVEVTHRQSVVSSVFPTPVGPQALWTNGSHNGSKLYMAEADSFRCMCHSGP